MFLIIALALSASGLKLAQYPDFETETEIIETVGECSDRMNYKCFKKGGHSLEKENAATYLRREVGIASITITVHNNCKLNQKITFGDATCGGVNAKVADYVLKSDDIEANAATTIPTSVTGDRCSAAAAITVASVVGGTAIGGAHTDCDESGEVTITATTRQTVAQTTAHYTVKMSGHGLHADDPSTKLVLGATAADATKCYSLECLYGASDAMTCATAPAVTALPSVLWWCNGNSLEAVYSNAAACAATLQTAINVGGVGTDCHDMLNWYLCPNFVLPTCA